MIYSVRNFNSNLYFLASRLLSALLLIPALTYFLNVRQVSEWFVYFSIFVVIQVFDAGLVSVGSRILKYSLDDYEISQAQSSLPLQKRVRLVNFPEIRGIIQNFYIWLSVIGPALIFISYSVISLLGNREFQVENYFWKLAFFCCLSGVFLYANYYISLLNAVNYYHFVQRYRGTIHWVISAIVAISLFFGADAFVCAALYHATHTAALIFLRFFVAGRVRDEAFDVPTHSSNSISSEISSSIGKTAVGLLLVVGIQQLVGIYIAENYDPKISASYFIFLQILRVGSTIGRSPLYSQLPNIYDQVRTSAQEVKNVLKYGLIGGLFFYLVYIILTPYGLLVFQFLGFLQEYYITRLYWLLALYLFLDLCGALIAESLTVWRVVIWRRAAFSVLAIFSVLVVPLERIYAVDGIVLALLSGYVLGFLPIAISAAVRQFWS